MQPSRIISAVLAGALLIAGACSTSTGTNQSANVVTEPNAAAAPNVAAEPKSAPVQPVASPEPISDGFITSDLNLPDMEESTAEATIGVTVTNTGTQKKTHTVELKIDGEVIGSKTITLAGGASENVTFTAWISEAGMHTVKIGQVSGELFWIGQN